MPGIMGKLSEVIDVTTLGFSEFALCSVTGAHLGEWTCGCISPGKVNMTGCE